jgi:hypothetical protein
MRRQKARRREIMGIRRKAMRKRKKMERRNRAIFQQRYHKLRKQFHKRIDTVRQTVEKTKKAMFDDSKFKATLNGIKTIIVNTFNDNIKGALNDEKIVQQISYGLKTPSNVLRAHIKTYDFLENTMTDKINMINREYVGLERKLISVKSQDMNFYESEMKILAQNKQEILSKYTQSLQKVKRERANIKSILNRRMQEEMERLRKENETKTLKLVQMNDHNVNNIF